MAARKTHWAVAEDTTGCGQSTKRRTISETPDGVTCPACASFTGKAEAKAEPKKRGKPKVATGVTATTTPPAVEGTLKGDALIARKRLAGAGRSAEGGTAFGSKWTVDERARLQVLYDEVGRTKAAAAFVEAHPHRTLAGAMYQIDRSLTKAGA